MIRLATEADLPHLPEIETQAATLFASVDLAGLFAADTLSLDQYRAYQQAGRLWVALEDDRPVGFIAMSFIEDHAHIDEVDVHPDYGLRGVGRAILATAAVAPPERGKKGEKGGQALTTLTKPPRQ